jgi:hypothetical protein
MRTFYSLAKEAVQQFCELLLDPVGLFPLVGLHGRLSEIVVLEIRKLALKLGKLRKYNYSEKTNVILGSGGTRFCDEMPSGMQNAKDAKSRIAITKQELNFPSEV